MMVRWSMPIVLAALAGCGTADPEAEVRAWLAAAEVAAEERDTGFFRAAFGAGYRDARGNDRERLVNTIRGYFVANQRIEVISLVDEVVLEGADAARVVLHAGIAGQRAGAALFDGVDSNLYRFELELVNDGEWRIIGASWRALGD